MFRGEDLEFRLLGFRVQGLLGGSGVVVSGLISRATILIIYIVSGDI